MSETTRPPKQSLAFYAFPAVVWALCAAPVFAEGADTPEAPLVIGVALSLPPYSFLDENGLATLGETGAHKRIHDKWFSVLIPRGASLSTVLKYTALAVVPLLLLLALSIVWSRTLKNQVAQRTLELSESEKRFRTICENAPVLINAFDENGRCLLWNKQCCETFGWTIDEINEHDDLLALLYPDPAVRDEITRTVTSDPDGEFREWHPVTKDGRTLTTMWANFSIPGDVVFSLGRDITESKRTAAALEASEERLNAFFQSSHVGLAMWDRDFRYILINDALQKINGPSREEHIGKTIEEVLPDAAHIIVPLFAEILSTGKPMLGMELCGEIPSRPGEITHYLVSYFPIPGTGREPQFIGGAVIDITERKRVDEELEKHRSHLEDLVRERTAELAELSAEQRLILDSVRAAIWYKDTENHILRSNKAAAESIGLSAEEIEGKSTEELFPDEAAKYYQDDLEVIRSGQPKLGIVESLRTPSGEVLWVLTDKIPIVDNTGSVTGIIVFAMDISKRKQAEIDLEKSSAELLTIVKAMAGRENRMAGLKKAIKRLRAQLEEAGLQPAADDPIIEE